MVLSLVKRANIEHQRKSMMAIAGSRHMRTSLSRILIVTTVLGVVGCAEKRVNYEVDLTAPSDFFLGPEDVLKVMVWKSPDLSGEVMIRPDGTITMPLIGDVPAAGLTANVLAKRIGDRLTEYVSSPVVTIQVKEVNSYFIYVLGEVVKPGKYPLKSYANVVQGISLAGGFGPFANKNKIKVLRNISTGPEGHEKKRQIEIPVHYNDILSGTAVPGNFFLRSGDVIVVP
ncbi:MAG: sugar ABC transporter substrate-binding protein [Nitrospira sp.]|nr:MAG: sugar ABC transporter substrate-binding protein [Nitrospira sp.]